MSRPFTRDAGAALVFAILYFLMWCYMTFMYATKRYKWKSRFTILYIHCIIRVASQCCGVAFGVLVFDNVNVFIAYLILGAEGYFSLTIASYYFLKHYEIGHFGRSNLGPAVPQKAKDRRERLSSIFLLVPIIMPWKFWHHDIIQIVDSWLIPANAIIIAGGSTMANVMSDKYTEQQRNDKLHLAKILRATGQAIFLALTVLYCALLIRVGRRIHKLVPQPPNIRPALVLFGISACMLLVRGIFGVLQAADYSMSYYNMNNYTSHGFTSRFIALEYCLGVMTEFVAASSLNASWWPSRHIQTEPLANNDALEMDQHSKAGSEAEVCLDGPVLKA